MSILIFQMAKFFFISLGSGLFTFSPLAKSELTGGGFQKLFSTICLASLLIAIIFHLLLGNSEIGLESILLYLSSICIIFHRQLHQIHDKKNAVLWALYLIPSLLGIVILYLFQEMNLLKFIFIVSEVFYLSSITYLMILGHWYLVTPKLTEKPLLKGIYLIWALIILKMTWSFFEICNSLDYLKLGTSLGGGYAFNWMIFIMRTVWGYFIIIGMSIFAYRLVKMRSIQSATGIFYAMTIFSFIGEIISSYLFLKYGLFI